MQTTHEKRVLSYLFALLICAAVFTAVIYYTVNGEEENVYTDYPAFIDDAHVYQEQTLTETQKSVAADCRIENYYVSGDYKVIRVVSDRGYADEIELLVLLEGTTVKKIQNLYNNETPGHGDICFRDRFLGRFEGKDLSVYRVLYGKDHTPVAADEILYVTSATITSTAIIDAVNAVSLFLQSLS